MRIHYPIYKVSATLKIKVHKKKKRIYKLLHKLTNSILSVFTYLYDQRINCPDTYDDVVNQNMQATQFYFNYIDNMLTEKNITLF